MDSWQSWPLDGEASGTLEVTQANTLPPFLGLGIQVVEELGENNLVGG